MSIEKGDYLVCVTEKKPFLAKVNVVAGKRIGVVQEKNSHIASLRNVFDVTKEQVVLNLGKEPRAGKVYGIDVGIRFRAKKVHDEFGDIAFFYNPGPEQGEKIMQAFTKAHKFLKHNKFDFMVQPARSMWEILPYNGEKYAGMYMKPKSDKIPHRFQIRPDIMPASDWGYVIYHELAHFMHLNMVTSDSLQARWIKLYNTTINVSDVSKDQCKSFLDMLLGGESRPSELRGDLDEDESKQYKQVLRWIKQHHNVSVKELDQLFVADEKDEIKSLWPTRVHFKDLAPLITEYATTNVKELVAESVAYYLSKRKLPQEVTKLVEKTLSHARTNQEA